MGLLLFDFTQETFLELAMIVRESVGANYS